MWGLVTPDSANTYYGVKVQAFTVDEIQTAVLPTLTTTSTAPLVQQQQYSSSSSSSSSCGSTIGSTSGTSSGGSSGSSDTSLPTLSMVIAENAKARKALCAILKQKLELHALLADEIAALQLAIAHIPNNIFTSI